MAKSAKERQARYDKENTTRISIKLNKKTDADIIEYLNRKSNKQGQIKEIVRNHLFIQNVIEKFQKN